MRNQSARFLIRAIVSLFGVGLANVCALNAQPLFGCIEELTIPKYPALARQARLQGKVHVKVDLNGSGKAIRSFSAEAAPILRDSVREVLETSKFSASCPTREFTIVFAFELDLNASPRAFDEGTVILRGAATIVIRAVRFPLSGSIVVPAPEKEYHDRDGGPGDPKRQLRTADAVEHQRRAGADGAECRRGTDFSD
jgi:TonB family protein